MRLEKLKTARNAPRCENGCRSESHGKDTGFRKAHFRFWIVGRPTYLCARCSSVWAEAWERARSNEWDDDARVHHGLAEKGVAA